MLCTLLKNLPSISYVGYFPFKYFHLSRDSELLCCLGSDTTDAYGAMTSLCRGAGSTPHGGNELAPPILAAY